LWDSFELNKYELGSGNFSQDVRGRWYANICVEVKPAVTTATTAVGIDLGLKDLVVTSIGERIEVQQFYRKVEPKLAIAQRARNRSRVRVLHARVANRRKDHLHKCTTRLVRQHAAILVGNVSASNLGRTSMAKSVYDAGWNAFRGMLRYKCAHAGVFFEEVDEAYSTQTCSSCGTLPSSRPKGIAGLGIREWTCTECGVIHDRDINAARNILARGHARLAGGSP
jgi:IS605 OrfB family transposase